MVKTIFFGALILILLMQVGYAENDTLIDSYSYDFIAEGTTVTMLDQMDTDEKTTITFELNTTPGNIEVSSVLGIVSIDQTFFSEGNDIVSVEFNKVLPGEKELLLMVYNEDALVAFITKDPIVIENNIELMASPDSLITLDEVLYVTFNVQTNMNILDSSAKIISKEGSIYESTDATLGNNEITYAFTLTESSEYNLYEISVNGYVKEFNHSLGSFDFSAIKNFNEQKTDAGLEISFSSPCSDCEKEITILSEEDEYVYNEKITSNSLTVPSELMYAMEINGPYKVIVNYEGNDFEFMTQSYTYGDFEPVVVEEEPVVEETPVEETQDTTSDSTNTEVSEETNVTEEETEVVTEDIDVVEEMIEEENQTEDMTEETTSEDVVEETSASEEPKSNLLTGFSVSNVKDFANNNKSAVYGGIALIIVLGILLVVYIKGRKDAYLYEM